MSKTREEKYEKLMRLIPEFERMLRKEQQAYFSVVVEAFQDYIKQIVLDQGEEIQKVKEKLQEVVKTMKELGIDLGFVQEKS